MLFYATRSQYTAFCFVLFLFDFADSSSVDAETDHSTPKRRVSKKHAHTPSDASTVSADTTGSEANADAVHTSILAECDQLITMRLDAFRTSLLKEVSDLT